MKPGRLAIALLMLVDLIASPALAQDARSQKLVDGFDGTDFASQGGLYYRENAEQAAGTYSFQNTVKRNGVGALELSVRPLCVANDDECSDRAEIWEKTPLRVPYDEPVWYGFAMKLAEPIPQDDHRYLMAQWKREIGPTAKGDFSPFIALRLNRGKMFFTVETNIIGGRPGTENGQCPAGSTAVSFRPHENQMRALVAFGTDWDDKDMVDFPGCTDRIRIVSHNPLPVATSDWIDFAIYSHPNAKGEGRVEIFANKIWITSVTGHIGHDDAGLGQNQYFKFGPYRAGHEGIWTVYYDDFRRSPDCIDVLGDQKICNTLK
ncbi:hypothetical protein HFC70_14350 [Agrobacterium sp. a22-2]|nr:hypothetical protein [Agrobacterium sp. a22-2]